MEISFNLEEINHAAREFLHMSGNARCFAFHGEMGAGKTTFIAKVCKLLGVAEGQSSPTFSIINEYVTQQKASIFHIDLYRLKDEQEAKAAGVEDCIFSGNYCFVEWPERAASLFPEGTVHCFLSLAGHDRRILQLKL